MPTTAIRDVNRSFCFQNDGAEAVICCLEPWADELQVGPGESCRFVLIGPEAGEPHLAWAPGRITVYAWEGSGGQLERLATPEEDWNWDDRIGIPAERQLQQLPTPEHEPILESGNSYRGPIMVVDPDPHQHKMVRGSDDSGGVENVSSSTTNGLQ